MIIYRVTGKCEAFKNCGMVFTEPQVSTSKGGAMKIAKKASVRSDKAGMKHTFIVRKLTLKKFDQNVALKLFGPEGCVEDLTESSETVGAFASENLPEAKLMPEAPPKYKDDLPF